MIQRVVKEISLNDLIAFIQDPVRYFFEQKLRVLRKQNKILRILKILL